MAAIPIWKDKYITFGEEDQSSTMFYVTAPGIPGRIYEGNAYKRPGDTLCKIRINDICADFLNNTLPSLSDSEFAALSFPIQFGFYWYNAEGNKWISESVQFINDWSYDRSYNASSAGMADPVNGHIDINQWMVVTALSATSLTAKLTYNTGRTTTTSIKVAVDSAFPASADFYRSVRCAGSGTAVFNLAAYSGVVKVEILGKAYNVVSNCRRYVLYYLNAYGGWDSLLIEGNAKESDNITRFSRVLEYDNTNVQSRGEQNCINEITKSYDLVTGWMSDEESSRMHHLINSTNVYLYDIVTQEMTPVVIPSTTCEHKKYKSNGNQLVNYTITANVAQNLVRR